MQSKQKCHHQMTIYVNCKYIIKKKNRLLTKIYTLNVKTNAKFEFGTPKINKVQMKL